MNYLVRNLFPPLKSLRFVSQSPYSSKAHEIVKTIGPESTIKVSSALKLIIRPYDLLDCPDANRLRATILSTCDKSTGNLSVHVDGTSVGIGNNLVKGDIEKLQCLLEVPVKADLEVNSTENVRISNMHSSFLHLVCKRDVFTKNLQGTTISIESQGGNVNSSGILLANKINVSTTGNGNLYLDKLQGDIFHCKTENGNINTNSCYADSSNFATEQGTLNLKNVHKKSEIHVLKEGDINMTGIHGNIYIKSNGGDMNLQFSEIYGDNIIMSNNSKQVLINISDLIEESCFIEIHSDQISLEESALHLSKYIENENYLNMGKEHDGKNKLLICAKGQLKFGKMSWVDSVRMAMGKKDLIR